MSIYNKNKTRVFCLLIFCLPLSVLCFAARSAEPNDTTTTLNEVVVEGRTQRAVKFGVEYIPGKKMKEMAMDATHLLAQMMIPSLRTDLQTGQVSALDGTAITYFINFVPAEPTDLAGMRTEDVLRVEVLDHPDDPRFNGAPKVINFIMQKYEWGGYTKLQGGGTVISNQFWTGSVYSKFVKKRWSYDLSVNTRGMHSKNNENSTDVESFKNIEFQGKHFDLLERTLHSGERFLKKHNHTDGLFRISYNDSTTLIRHAIYLTGYKNFNRNSSSITFTDDVLPSTSSFTAGTESSISPMVTGQYQFYLPKGNVVVANWNFRYDRNKSNSSHIFGADKPIINDNAENNYSPNFDITYWKYFSHNNMMKIAVASSNSIYNTDYQGSYDGKQDILTSSNRLHVGYYQSWGFGLSVFGQAGVSYMINKIAGETKLNKLDPSIGTQIQYTPNQRNYLSLTANYMSISPEAGNSSSVLIQNNELLWLEGNPNLRNTKVTNISASYSFLPTNWFSMYANLMYVNEIDRPTADFYTLPGHDGVVRRTLDGGTKNLYEATISGSFRLLNNSLSFNITGNADRVEFSGINPRTYQWIGGRISASYYLKNFLFSLSYSSPEKAVYGSNLNEFSNQGDSYSVGITFSKKNFKASLSFRNWFEKYRKSTLEYDSPRYSYLRTNYNRGRMLSLNLSYTFTYGKKINMSDEAYGAGEPNSAVLK